MSRSCTISGVLEVERTWARLHTPGMLRKVGLLPPSQTIVQVDKAPPTWVSVMLHKKSFYLFIADRFFLLYLQICGASLQTSNLLHAGHIKLGHQDLPKERPTVGDKRWRSTEEPTFKNRHVAEPSGLMEASQSAAREEESHQHRQREVIDFSEQ